MFKMIINPQYTVCAECFEIYNSTIFDIDSDKYKTCPKTTCAGKLVLLDENMIPIFIELNKKGYKTHACCSSHIWNGFIYVSFCPDIVIPDNIPDGFSLQERPWNQSNAAIHDKYHYVIRKKLEFSGLSMIERQIKMFESLMILLSWVEKLPKEDDLK